MLLVVLTNHQVQMASLLGSTSIISGNSCLSFPLECCSLINFLFSETRFQWQSLGCPWTQDPPPAFRVLELHWALARSWPNSLWHHAQPILPGLRHSHCARIPSIHTTLPVISLGLAPTRPGVFIFLFVVYPIPLETCLWYAVKAQAWQIQQLNIKAD